MKLVFAIVNNEDGNLVMRELNKAGFCYKNGVDRRIPACRKHNAAGWDDGGRSTSGGRCY